MEETNDTRVNFWAKGTLFGEFKEVCDADGRSISDVLRQLMREYIIWRKEGLKRKMIDNKKQEN